jgi:hypothetical protein
VNAATLAAAQAYANDQLRTRGHLFLNELLDLLELPRVRQGQTAGWVWKKFQFGSLVTLGVFERGRAFDFLKTNTPVIPLVIDCNDDILDLVFGPVTETTVVNQ